MDLVKFKDNKITEISTKVENFDDNLKNLVDNMIKVMHKYDGIGLAAIQIGIPQRVIVVEVQPGQILVAINPEIIWKSEKFSEMKEANLSLDDGIKVLVRRSQNKISRFRWKLARIKSNRNVSYLYTTRNGTNG